MVIAQVYQALATRWNFGTKIYHVLLACRWPSQIDIGDSAPALNLRTQLRVMFDFLTLRCHSIFCAVWLGILIWLPSTECFPSSLVVIFFFDERLISKLGVLFGTYLSRNSSPKHPSSPKSINAEQVYTLVFMFRISHITEQFVIAICHSHFTHFAETNEY